MPKVTPLAACAALALGLGACTQFGIDYVMVGDGVRALYHPGVAEPFRYEMQVHDSVQWYEATPVGDHFVLTTRGRTHLSQDQTRGDEWEVP